MLPLRQFFPPLPYKNKKDSDSYLILEIGLERVIAGVFQTSSTPKLLGLGKSVIGEAGVTESVLRALEGLEAVVEALPEKVVLGLADSSKIEKKISKVERANPEKEVTRSELEEILENSSPKLFGDDQLYFSSLIYVILEGKLVNQPIGARGKSLEIGILNAYYQQGSLEAIQSLLTDSNLELQRIVPTPHALALVALETEMLGLLVVRVGEQKTQVISIKAATVDEVRSFDLGSQNLDFWLQGLITTLEQNNFELPESIWVYNENSSAEDLIAKLKTYAWQEKFGLTTNITGPQPKQPLLGEDLSLSSLVRYTVEDNRR